MIRILLISLCAVACAPKVPPLTKSQHRAEAERHAKKAAEEEAKYDPGRTVRTPARTPFAEPGGDWIAYNPTERHLERADAEMREAAAHAKAAAALVAFENEACREIPAAERASCPLLASQVSKVQHTQSGLRLTVKKGADADEINRRLNCHLAFAVANGFDSPSCPLFVKGMVIRVADPGVLELTAPQPEVVAQLHNQARWVFTGSLKPTDLPMTTR